MFSVDLHAAAAAFSAPPANANGTNVSSVPINLAAVTEQLTHDSDYYSAFVTWAYQQFLGRAPDAGGLAGWVSRMEQGLSDEQLESGFISAPEYIAVHGGSDVNWVIGMYHDLLGRAPAPSEIDGWRNVIESGTSEYNIALGFAASPEREAIVVTNDYNTLLLRPPSQVDINGWVDLFEHHGQQNEDVVAGFVSSPEYYDNAAKGGGNCTSWIASAFEDLYKRQPTDAEVSSLLSQLGQGGNPLSPPTVNDNGVTATQAALSWNSVAGATGYLVDELVNGAWQQIDQFDSNTTNATINQLSPNTAYTFEVGAYNSAGAAWSSPVSFTTSSALVAPTANASGVTATQATLSWNSVAGATGYLVDELVNGAWQQIGQFESNTTSATINQLSPNTAYTFEVGAYNSAGAAWSSPVSLTTSSAFVAPTANASGVTATQATLSWSSVAGATGYLVDELVNGTWQQIGQFDSNTTSATINQLSPNTAYTFEVGAYNSAGAAWSSPVSFTTSSALTGPSVTASGVTATQATLSWSSVAGATGYVIDELVNGTWQQIGQFNSNTTSTTISQLSSSTTYTFDVGAYNSAGAAWSSPISVTTSSQSITVKEPAAGAAYLPVSGTLFGSSGPLYTDVHQGAEGDCWLMASLAEVAARDPLAIERMFTYQGTADENGATVGVYSVRFFTPAGGAEYVTVDTELPAGGGFYDHPENGVLWAALAEKAYAEANGAGYVTSQHVGYDNYDALDGGYANWALQAITGNTSNTYTINPTSVAAALNAGQLVVLGTSASANDANGIVGDSNGTHAYAVVNYYPASSEPFELYNPWGTSTYTTYDGHQVFGNTFFANGACLAQDFATDSFAVVANDTGLVEQASVTQATPGAAAAGVAIAAQGATAAATPTLSARDAAFAEASWLDDLYD